MTMTDPIADLLTQVRNAIIAKHDRVQVPASKLKLALCDLLHREGYIQSFAKKELEGPGDAIEILLKYNQDGVPAITKMERVSKPGRRVYRGAADLRPVLNGIGVAIVSTSRGLMTDAQARTERVGGEVLCQIY